MEIEQLSVYNLIYGFIFSSVHCKVSLCDWGYCNYSNTRENIISMLSQSSQPTSTDVYSTMYNSTRMAPSPTVSCDELVCFIVPMTTGSGDGTSSITSVHTAYRDTGI